MKPLHSILVKSIHNLLPGQYTVKEALHSILVKSIQLRQSLPDLLQGTLHSILVKSILTYKPALYLNTCLYIPFWLNLYALWNATGNQVA